jgi:hypothetical protein
MMVDVGFYAPDLSIQDCAGESMTFVGIVMIVDSHTLNPEVSVQVHREECSCIS